MEVVGDKRGLDMSANLSPIKGKSKSPLNSLAWWIHGAEQSCSMHSRFPLVKVLTHTSTPYVAVGPGLRGV